jgi:hypothetical protein
MKYKEGTKRKILIFQLRSYILVRTFEKKQNVLIPNKGVLDVCWVHNNELCRISPQSAILSICYYHQDLHWRWLQAGSCPDPSALTAKPSYSSCLPAAVYRHGSSVPSIFRASCFCMPLDDGRMTETFVEITSEEEKKNYRIDGT